MRRIVRPAALVCAVIAVIALPASSAGAATTNPTSLDFGSVPVGSTSTPQSVTVNTTCIADISIPVLCNLVDPGILTVTATTSGDFSASSAGCPGALVPLPGVPASCPISVSFSPKSAGAQSGTLNTGLLGTLPGPAVPLSGTGIAPVSSQPGTKKKCKKKSKKKKRSASSAKKKKCKKKKKR